MNLKPINPAPRPGLYKLLCCKCGQWTDGAETFADLDGEPFQAFYCAICATDLRDFRNTGA